LEERELGNVDGLDVRRERSGAIGKAGAFRESTGRCVGFRIGGGVGIEKGSP
jgi:exopolysaccharide biosynthesis protein